MQEMAGFHRSRTGIWCAILQTNMMENAMAICLAGDVHTLEQRKYPFWMNDVLNCLPSWYICWKIRLAAELGIAQNGGHLNGGLIKNKNLLRS